jgi:predicted anti-sigma-YlaC factor YlaD
MKCNCEDIRELMPDLAAGLGDPGSDVKTHLQNCAACKAELEDFRRTLALLDEWKTPEPSPYFDVRLQAKLREEMAKKPVSWLHWLRRPALAVSLMVLMVGGVTLIQTGGRKGTQATVIEPGTAVGDLQALDKNHELYSDFDVLDDLQVQHDVIANP